jgi:hypothetical protein
VSSGESDDALVLLLSYPVAPYWFKTAGLGIVDGVLYFKIASEAEIR